MVDAKKKTSRIKKYFLKSVLEISDNYVNPVVLKKFSKKKKIADFFISVRSKHYSLRIGGLMKKYFK